MKLVAIGERYVAGERIEGWVVTVRDAESRDLRAIKAIDAHLERFIRSGALGAVKLEAGK